MNEKKIFWCFFILYALFGFYTMPQFGVPLDELTQRYIGIGNFRFVAGRVPAEDVESSKYFGPVFESFCYGLEHLIMDEPLRIKLYLRHILLFSIFLIAVYCIYFVALRIFKRKGTAELVIMMLALYPPLFAHAHYNSKDTLFLCLLVFCIYFFVKYYESQKLKWIIYVSVFIGMATTVRFSGVFILLSFSIGILLWQEITLKKRIGLITLIFGISLLSFYLFFPFFWLHPIKGWSVLWQYVTNNPWCWDILVGGVWVKAGMHPWWYLSTWMGVTIPAIMLVLFFIGLVRTMINKTIYKEVLVFIIVSLFIVPFFYITILKPTLYDGWRHVQFLIVPLCFIAGFGVESFFSQRNQVLKFWAISIYSIFIFISSYPYQYVYFNEIYMTFIKRNSFTQDYWCLSSNQCLQWISDNDSSQGIKVSSFTESPEMQSIWLGFEDKHKFRFTQKTGTGKYEIQIRRAEFFEKLPGREVFTICPMKDTIARVLLLD